MAIRVKKINTRSNFLELKVLAEVSSYPSFYETLDQYKNAFNSTITNIKTGNHSKAELAYKLAEEKGCLRLWKLDKDGQPCRLVLFVEAV